MNIGWLCVKCNRSYSPLYFECTMCNLKTTQLEEIIKKEDENSHILSKEVYDLELSVRTTNILKNEAKIKTVGELVIMTENDFIKLPNAGRRSLEEVKSVLKHHGLCLGMRRKE